MKTISLAHVTSTHWVDQLDELTIMSTATVTSTHGVEHS